MTKIKPEHLPAFAQELEMALREGIVSPVQAKDFSDAVFTAALDQQARGAYRPVITPEGNQNASNSKTIKRRP